MAEHGIGDAGAGEFVEIAVAEVVQSVGKVGDVEVEFGHGVVRAGDAKGLFAAFFLLPLKGVDFAVGVGGAELDAGDVDLAGGGATGGVEVGDF